MVKYLVDVLEGLSLILNINIMWNKYNYSLIIKGNVNVYNVQK